MLVKLAKKYKISVEKVKELRSRGCEICGSRDKLNIDHCHSSERVRGCLCRTCNLALGYIKESPANAVGLYNYVVRVC